jgi:hypothetical protein
MGSTSPLTPRNLLQVLDQLNAARAIEQLERWHQQADFCQSTEPEPWQIGACDAALLSAGPELANWLISKGCDNTKIRSMAIREAAANLDIETSLALAKLGEGSLKLRLIKLLKLS